MSTWNYRIIECNDIHQMGSKTVGDHYFQIVEARYEEGATEPNSYAETGVIGDDVDGLRWTLNRMMESLEKPVLDADKFKDGGA